MGYRIHTGQGTSDVSKHSFRRSFRHVSIFPGQLYGLGFLPLRCVRCSHCLLAHYETRVLSHCFGLCIVAIATALLLLLCGVFIPLDLTIRCHIRHAQDLDDSQLRKLSRGGAPARALNKVDG